MSSDKDKPPDRSKVMSTPSNRSPPFNGFLDQDLNVSRSMNYNDNAGSSSENSEDRTNSKTNSRLRYYPESVAGPYTVYICKLKPADKMDIIKVNNYLHEHYKSVVSIKPINHMKLRIEFKNLQEANNATRDSNLNSAFNVYIPAIRVECYGTIVYTADSSAESILEFGVGKFKDPRLNTIKILEVHRNEYKNDDNKWVHKNSVRLTFEGTLVPDYVALDNLLIRVKLYVPSVMSCANCLKYGHTVKFCNRKTRCAKCYKNHDTSGCEMLTQPKCHDCELDHITGDKSCRKRRDIQAIKKQMYINSSQRSYELLSQTLQDEDLSTPGVATNEDFIPDLSNPFKKQRTHKKGISNKRKCGDNNSQETPIPSCSSKSYSHVASSQNHDSNLVDAVQKIILEFIRDLQLSPLLNSLFEKFILPFVVKICTLIEIKLANVFSSTFFNGC